MNVFRGMVRIVCKTYSIIVHWIILLPYALFSILSPGISLSILSNESSVFLASGKGL